MSIWNNGGEYNSTIVPFFYTFVSLPLHNLVFGILVCYIKGIIIKKKELQEVSMESMEVKVIQNAGELETLPPFQVDKKLWGTKKSPTTYGYLGFVPDDGFYLKMVCEEADPLRTYTQINDPVYRDSALEAFFLFESERERYVQPTYLNFEVNANGALLAGYGKERVYRAYFSPEEHREFACSAVVEADRWSVSLRIPVSILENIYGPLYLEAGSTFTCNFYKISESAQIEHYASWSVIDTDIPSFHLPEYFGSAVITDRQHR